MVDHCGRDCRRGLKYKNVLSYEEDLLFRAAGKTVENKDLSNSFDLMKSTFSDLINESGAQVISAAGGAEYAQESAQWNNGVFTYSLKNGLINKKADLNNDQQIMLSELSEFLKHEVKHLTQGKQQPTSRAINRKQNVVIYAF